MDSWITTSLFSNLNFPTTTVSLSQLLWHKPSLTQNPLTVKYMTNQEGEEGREEGTGEEGKGLGQEGRGEEAVEN